MSAADDAARGVPLTELLAVMSLGTDLGMGHPLEHVIRQSVIALRLAELMQMSGGECVVVHHTSMLSWIGCHTDAYEQAKWFGDDRAVKRDIRAVDLGAPVSSTLFLLRNIGAGRPLTDRLRTGIGFIGAGWRDMDATLSNHCSSADMLAERLGFDDAVRAALRQTFERWDGKGEPDGVRGEEAELTARIVNLADVVEVFHRAAGVEAATTVARERRCTQFDPAIVDLFCDHANELLDDLDGANSWELLQRTAPANERVLDDSELEAALEVLGEFADLKSPYTIGHSSAVAELAATAAAEAGAVPVDVTCVRRAGFVHDLGTLGVSNDVWDKTGPLTWSEQERMRLHPYLTERMLAFSPSLMPLAAVAAQHHERLDGSGYPLGLSGDSLSRSARLLAAADTYQAKTEPRPHRSAMASDEIATHLREQVRAGRHDGEAVDSVLRAAGHRVRRRRGWPAGLTAREVEVLRLVALGMSTKEIAARLVISRKTAANHVERIYAKIGVSNRAMASVFAMRHGLMSP